MKIAGIGTNHASGSIKYVTQQFYRHRKIDQIDVNAPNIPFGETLRIKYLISRQVSEICREYDAVFYPLLQYAAKKPPENIFSVIYVHDLYYFSKKSPKLETVFKGNILENLQEFDLIVANSEHTKRALESVLYCEKNISVVQPGVEEFYKPVKNPNSSDRKFILYVGSFWDRKNTSFLLEVLNHLNEDYKLICAGRYYNENKKKEFLQEAKEKKLEERVQVLGEISKNKLRELFSTSDIYIHPAKKGGFEITPLEAAACGTRAAVYSQIPSSEALNSQNHLIFDEFDAEVLSSSIRKENKDNNPQKVRRWEEARNELVDKIRQSIQDKNDT